MRYDRISSMEQYILRHGSATLEALAEYFNVSINTVRRDVSEIVKKGDVIKVYGGVSVAADGLLPMSVRSNKNSGAKHGIGRLAAELVVNNSTVFLDSGSTAVCVLPHLACKKNVTVVTHSLSALYEASKHPELQIIALGGLYSPPTSSYVGTSVMDTIKTLNIQTVFIAATGVSVEQGLTNNTFLEAQIKRTVVEHNSNVILLADHSKFDRKALFSFARLSDLSAIVTDVPPDEHYLTELAKSGTRLLCPEMDI